MNTPPLSSCRLAVPPRWGIAAALVVVVSLLWLAAPAQACPNCRTILSENESAQQVTEQQQQAVAMARAISWSVLFMMAMPFTLVGGMGFGLWYVIRKADAKQQHA